MNRLLRQVARLLLCVTLITVLTPCFGWEAAGGSAMVDHGTMADASPCPMDDCMDHDQGDSNTQPQHGCAGHQLGHLFGTIEAPYSHGVVPSNDGIPVSAPMAFLTHIPAGLERPPRTAAL